MEVKFRFGVTSAVLALLVGEWDKDRREVVWSESSGIEGDSMHRTIRMRDGRSFWVHWRGEHKVVLVATGQQDSAEVMTADLNRSLQLKNAVIGEVPAEPVLVLDGDLRDAALPFRTLRLEGAKRKGGKLIIPHATWAVRVSPDGKVTLPPYIPGWVAEVINAPQWVVDFFSGQ